MITSANLNNFTVFSHAQFRFAGLNVIHGENGAGKTHLLKLLYAMWQAAARPSLGDDRPIRSRLNRSLAETLIRTFLPEQLGHLVRNGEKRSEIVLRFAEPAADFSLALGHRTTAEVEVTDLPPVWRNGEAVYLPPKELLSLQPEFLGLASERHLPFDQTWTDASTLLVRPLSRGPRPKALSPIIETLEKALGGTVVTEPTGRFKLQVGAHRIEAHLLAEGHRKLATLLQLLLNRSLHDKGAFFWDEPEANLNPRLIKTLAPILLHLHTVGVQVFVATHSLFLLEELDFLASNSPTPDTAFIGLEFDGPSLHVHQGPRLSDSGSIIALDEQLAQADRLLAKTLVFK